MIGVGFCVLSGFSAVAVAATADGQQTESQHREAVQLARGGKYDQSLSILQSLEAQGDTESGFWADYVTILSWAGKDQEMLAVADKHYGNDFSSLPEYAGMPLARTYFQNGQEEKGCEVLTALIAKGSAAAKLAYAEHVQQTGQYQAGKDIYGELAVTDAVPAIKLYESQARAAMDRNDFIEAERYFSLMKSSASASDDDTVRDVDALRAALYIRHREEDRAVNILRPYVENGQATMNMVSDYLTALRFDNKQKEAIADFKKYCPDWSKMPVYGLQNMADLYLRAGKFSQADELYIYILTREDIGYVRMGHAYCLAMNRHEGKAYAEYQTIVQKYSNLQSAVATDGTTFLSMGKIHLARELYGLVGTTPAEKNAYQLQYATALSDIDTDTDNEGMNFEQTEILNGRTYYHEAQDILQRLSNDPELGVAARAGLAANKVKKGLYADADRMLQSLNEKNSMAPEVSAANMANNRRLEKDAHVYFESGVDYLRDRTDEYGVDGSCYLGGNVYATSSFVQYVLHDDDARALYHRSTLGLSYRYDRGQVNLAYGLYAGDSDMNSLIAGLTYEFNDLATLTFSSERRPHAVASAVLGGIDERAYSIRWDQIVNDKLRLGFQYEWSRLTDSNRYKNYTFDGVYGLSANTAYRDNLLFNFSHGGYDRTSDLYNSPSRRIDFAAGFSRKWMIPRKNRTWEWITMLGWGHDNNDGNGFEPMTRVEMMQELKANQTLVVGMEYDWHRGMVDTDTTNYRSGGYLFDVNYYIGW